MHSFLWPSPTHHLLSLAYTDAHLTGKNAYARFPNVHLDSVVPSVFCIQLEAEEILRGAGLCVSVTELRQLLSVVHLLRYHARHLQLKCVFLLPKVVILVRSECRLLGIAGHESLSRLLKLVDVTVVCAE